MSIAQTLGKCIAVLQMLSENNLDEHEDKYSIDNDCLDKTERNEDDQVKKKQKLLTLFEERLQHILKCMIKLAMAKTSKYLPIINNFVMQI